MKLAKEVNFPAFLEAAFAKIVQLVFPLIYWDQSIAMHACQGDIQAWQSRQPASLVLWESLRAQRILRSAPCVDLEQRRQELASPECTVCPKGTKSAFNDDGYQKCVNCQINEYQSKEGSTVCEKCRCGKVSAVRAAKCKEPVSRDALAQIDPPKTMIQFGPRSIRIAFDPLRNIYNGRLLYYQLEWTSIIRDGVPDFSSTCKGN